MTIEVRMPVITGEGEDAVVTAWFVDEGQACKTGQLIAEVQAEKVSEEIEAPEDGFVVDRVALGDPVPQGGLICRITASVERLESAEVSSGGHDGSSIMPVRASPAAKRIARELGVELAAIAGTGPEGRITEADVRDAADGGSGMRGLRAVVAKNMRRSHAETAPVTIFTTVTLTDGVPSHLTATIVKMAAEVLADHRALNGTRRGDVFTSSVHADIGVAIQTDDGLVAPVVRNAAGMTVDDIARRIADLAERARGRALEAGDFKGATFTVSNLGPFGVEGFTPIIDLPQIAILGVGAARRVPVVDPDGTVVAGHEMVLSLTFDHAFVDGAPAAAFLDQLREALEV